MWITSELGAFSEANAAGVEERRHIPGMLYKFSNIWISYNGTR